MSIPACVKFNILYVSDMHQISAVENPALKKVETEEEVVIPPDTYIASKEKWYDDLDTFSDPPDAGEIDDRLSDMSDYEEPYKKKKKKVRQVNINFCLISINCLLLSC